jgi:hypothetical protein
MNRYMLTVILVAAAAGCTPTYRVHVNTFSQFPEPLSHSHAIYVAADPNSRNPILATHIATKMRNALQEQGYAIAEKPSGAAYMLTFRTGMDSAHVVNYLPVSPPYGGLGYYGRFGYCGRFGSYPGCGYGPWGWGWGLGYATYVPYIETVYTNWLDTQLYPLHQNAASIPQPVWIGEAVVGTDEPDLRKAVNYLLAGVMEYFATDTRAWRTVRLKGNDPRVAELAATP